MPVLCKAVEAVDTPPVPLPVDASDILEAVAMKAHIALCCCANGLVDRNVLGGLLFFPSYRCWSRRWQDFQSQMCSRLFRRRIGSLNRV